MPARNFRTAHSPVLRGLSLAATFAMMLAASCAREAKPTPLNAALNAPEGSPEKAPDRPSDLRPPPAPPQPGHIGRAP